MNVTSAPRMSGCSHTSNPHCDAQTCISGRGEAGEKHWLESGSLTQALLRSAWFQLLKDFVLFRQPSRCAAEAAGKKEKRLSGFSAVLYAAVHCEINELSLILEFLQTAF